MPRGGPRMTIERLLLARSDARLAAREPNTDKTKAGGAR